MSRLVVKVPQSINDSQYKLTTPNQQYVASISPNLLAVLSAGAVECRDIQCGPKKWYLSYNVIYVREVSLFDPLCRPTHTRRAAALSLVDRLRQRATTVADAARATLRRRTEVASRYRYVESFWIGTLIY